MAITEFSFSVDDFQDPKVYKDAEAIQVLLTRLILLEPGLLQSHPEAGVGINSRYKYATEDQTSALKSDIQSQIQTYLPQFDGAVVNVNYKERTFMISIEIDDTIYGIFYESETGNLHSNYMRLLDL